MCNPHVNQVNPKQNFLSETVGRPLPLTTKWPKEQKWEDHLTSHSLKEYPFQLQYIQEIRLAARFYNSGTIKTGHLRN